MTVIEWLRKRVHSRIFETPVARMPLSPAQILARKRSSVFDSLRNCRLIVGAFRYGVDGGYDCIESAIWRLKRYQESGNKELLIDAANLCELEWIQGNHPLAHFESTDDGKHCDPIEEPYGSERT